MPTGTISRCGGTATSLYEFEVLNLHPDALWPLYETSGTVAHDITGNGHHLGVAPAVAPTWAQIIAPTGTQAPFFANLQRIGSAAPTYVPNTANPFAVGAWFYTFGTRDGTEDHVITKGDPITNLSGFYLGFTSATSAPAKRVDGVFGGGGGLVAITGDSTLSFQVWYHLGLDYNGTRMALRVNGVQQASTSTAAYSNDGSAILIGPAQGTGTSMAYAFYFPRSLSDSEWLTLATVP